MEKKLSRRELLRSAAGASLALSGIPALRKVRTADTLSTASAPVASSPASNPILPLTSTSEVIIPPRGVSFMKFSYDFPEPAVEFGGLRFSFRLHTFENTYGLDRRAITVQAVPSGLDVSCTQLVWAGGQQTAPGKMQVRIRKNGDQIEWSASAEMERPIKSIVAIVRGVPRGKISAGGLRHIPSQSVRNKMSGSIIESQPADSGSGISARNSKTGPADPAWSSAPASPRAPWVSNSRQ